MLFSELAANLIANVSSPTKGTLSLELRVMNFHILPQDAVYFI